jgi:hypothetical protein
MGEHLEGRWMSYAELATARHTKRTTVVRLARARRWPKQPANDGTIRILVPPGWDEPDERSPRQPPSAPAEAPPEEPPAAQAFLLALEEINRAHVAEVEALRSLADGVLMQLADAQGAAQRAQAEAEELRQADAARRAQRDAMGRLARLLAAWKG